MPFRRSRIYAHVTLDEAEAVIRAAWEGLPADQIPPSIADFLVAEGTVYEHAGRLWMADGS